MDSNKCPNCGTSLKGLLSSDLLPQSKIDFINNNVTEKKDGYCRKCGNSLLNEIAETFKTEKIDIETRLEKIIHHIPIMTSPAPVTWDYKVLGMITAQTTSGTGFATEFSRSFNDFFGKGSNATNQKVAAATNLCKADLRVQCVKQGGNAIISTDIDFNEIGGGSTNMLMVCMAGTAIVVSDMSNFGEKRKETIIEVIELTEKLEAISEISKHANSHILS